MTEKPKSAPVDFAARMLDCYRATGNPLYAWDALAFHGLKEPLPEELAAYLMGVALNLGKIGTAVRNRELEPTEAARLIPEALGIVSSQSNFNAFTAEQRDNNAAWVASGYEFYGGGPKAVAALVHETNPRTCNQLAAAKKKVRRQLKRAREAGRMIDD
jgi:hypothetical protein